MEGNHAYYKLWNNKNDSKVEIIIDAPMLHVKAKEFVGRINDAVRELGEETKYDIKVTIK